MTNVHSNVSWDTNVLYLLGTIKTELGRNFSGKCYSCMTSMFSVFMITPEQGAETTLYCCLEDSIEKDSGKYYANCKQVGTKRSATGTEEDWKRLWDISEKLIEEAEKK